MKKTIVPIFILAILSLVACSGDKECDLCMSPPNFFTFDLVDKDSGENVFASGRYNSDDIEVLDASGHRVEFEFVNYEDFNFIEIRTIGWQTETVNYRINIGEENIFDLYVDAERLSENCCSFTRYQEIEISNAEYTNDPLTGIYKIIVE